MCYVLNVGQWFANGTKPSDSLGLVVAPKLENTVIQCSLQRLFNVVFCWGICPFHHSISQLSLSTGGISEQIPIMFSFQLLKVMRNLCRWCLDGWTQALSSVRLTFLFQCQIFSVIYGPRMERKIGLKKGKEMSFLNRYIKVDISGLFSAFLSKYISIRLHLPNSS